MDIIGPNLEKKAILVLEMLFVVNDSLLTQVDEVLVCCVRRQSPDVKVSS